MTDRARFTIVQQGDKNSAVQINGAAGASGDLGADREAMAKFIDAAAGALAALDLSSEAREEAARTVEALRADEGEEAAGSDRRRALAGRLWRIVEGAAAGALGSGLLEIWHP